MTQSDSRTSHQFPLAVAGVSTVAWVPNWSPSDYYDPAHANASASASLGNNSVSSSGIADADWSASFDAAATASWFDTFYSASNTTFLLTATLNDHFSEFCLLPNGSRCSDLGVEYDLLISTIPGQISLTDSNLNYSPEVVDSTTQLNVYSQFGVSQVFTVPGGTTFSISSQLSASSHGPGASNGALSEAAGANAWASFQLRPLSGSYTTASGTSYVPISDVAEPSCLWLLGVGLLGLSLLIAIAHGR